MIALAVRAGVQRIVLNGSFVTDTIEPNDVDCVLLVSSDYPKDVSAARDLRKGLPVLDLIVVEPEEFAHFVDRFFAADREFEAKGMIEVIL